jgi:hypothetical protein
MELTELRCKNCGAPIREENLFLDMAMAKCDHCGAVFGLKGAPSQASQAQYQTTERPQVSMPRNIEVADTGSALQIVYRWFSWKYIPLILFAAFWNGFMLIWHSNALISGNWQMSLFGLLHTAVGIGLVYYILAGILNRTTIWVEAGTIHIRNHPIPWPGNKYLDAIDIAQLYCREKIHRGRRGTNYSYEMHAVMHDGRTEKLLSRFDRPEQTLYIEQEMEKYLGIRDQPVQGELQRW